ncbi:DDE-type integrase/transposase/recombinase [Crinalium epipsammum]|uniref:DDE-type integrase/transposase/recombinase n=1 Tax=Crinalium epipsammum TaxID=241425 RepID=UPI00031CD7DA|nr:DDE-type integrase/transposase/recombinase [Crinalium epipsammum]
MNEPPTLEQLEEDLSAKKNFSILEELIEDAEERYKILLKYKAVEEIINAPEAKKKELIQLWADKLSKSIWTIQRMLKRVELEGIAALARTKRTDAGKLMGFHSWKKNSNEQWRSREEAVGYWKAFIEEKYRKGNTASRRMSANQVFNRVKDHAELDLGLKQGEYPSHVFVYKILEPIILDKQLKVRRPNQGPGIVIQCFSKFTKKDKVKEEILVKRSNQVWQIDHTRLDNLLIDANGERIGSVYITSVIDTYSGCALGYHLGFDAAGSHEVALALRHAILPKYYGAEYQLQEKWIPCGLPDYIVTDNAEEFHSRHLKRIATQLRHQITLSSLYRARWSHRAIIP